MNDIITVLITSVTSIILSLIPVLIAHKATKKSQSSALLMILQSQLTNIYFAYEQIGEIPDYIYRNWKNMLSIYEKLGGDDYIHELDKRMSNWKITHTGVLIK